MDSEMERLLQAVADKAAQAVAARVPTKEDMEQIAERISARISHRVAERALESFAERLNIPVENLDDWHADRIWLRNRRQLETAVIRQGIGAVVLAILSALGTAVWFWLKSGGPMR